MPPEVGVIAIVSEQIVPVVLHLWHVQAAHPEGLSKVVLLHTSDKTRSRMPAERIQALWKAHFPQISCACRQVEIRPQDVRSEIRRLQSDHPEIQTWHINMTGGLKTMVLGVGDVAGEPGIEVIYREIQAGWFALERRTDGLYAQELPPQAISHRAADSLTALEIATAQLGELETREEKKVPWPVLVPQAAALAGAVAESGSDWTPVRERLGGVSNGTAFEALLAASLTSCGIPGLALQLVSRLEVSQQPLFESDIAVWKDGRLWIFDLSLHRGGEGANTRRVSFEKHVQLAAQTRRRLGGLDAQWVLVRPTRRLTPHEREVANDAHIVRVFDAGELGGFLPQAARWLGGTVPPDLKQAFVALSRALSSGAAP